MNWIFYSFIMFFCSNALYLLTRKVQKEGVPIPVYSVIRFAIPAMMFFAIDLATPDKIPLTARSLLLIAVTAFFWSYLGNFFSQKGIFHAPNPGYSLILQKSYVVLTTIAAYFLFRSDLSTSKVIAILIILGFSIIVSSSKKKKEASNLKWVFFSVAAHLCYAYGSLMSKHFLNIGLEPQTYLFYVVAIVAILNYVEVKTKKLSFAIKKNQWLMIIAMGISGALFNFFMQQGFKVAPNPGYVSAINTSSIISLTLLSAGIFKDKLSVRKLLGISGVTAGLFLLLLGK